MVPPVDGRPSDSRDPVGAIDVILIKILSKQSNTINTAHAQGAGMQTDGSALTAAGTLGALLKNMMNRKVVQGKYLQYPFLDTRPPYLSSR